MSTSIHSNEFMSREALAGRDRNVVESARVLLVGAGAVGSNFAQTAALSGIGELCIVDSDRIEGPNLTRSPLFRDADQGMFKAEVLARRCQEISYARQPRIRFAHARCEDLGHGIFENINVVVAAVDSLAARAMLADRTMHRGIPLIETGFDRFRVHVSTWLNASPDAACFRCLVPHATTARASCAVYAGLVEDSGFLPAVQTAAAVAGNLAAEAVMQVLHRAARDTQYWELDIQTGESVRVSARRSPSCRGTHARMPLPGCLASVDETVWTVLDRLRFGEHQAERRLLLPEPFLVEAPCAWCGARIEMGMPVSRAPVPKCAKCPEATPFAKSVALQVVTSVRAFDHLARKPLSFFGFQPRDRILVASDDSDDLVCVALRGGIEHLVVTLTGDAT